MRIRKIKLEGAPFERGLQHAEQLGAVMEVHAFPYFSKRASLGGDRVDRAVALYLKHLDRSCSDEVRELEGLAEGLDVPLQKIAEHNFYGDVLAVAATMEGCSCMGKQTNQGVLLSKNNDAVPTYPDAHILYHVKPDKGYENIYVAFTGMIHNPSVNGVNSAGFGMAGASIGPVYMEFRIDAIERSIFAKRVLQYAANVEEALSMFADAMKGPGLGGGANCVLGDKTGRLVAVEFTDKDLYVEEAKDGVAFRTNHPLSPVISKKLMEKEEFLKGLDNSRRRYETLGRLLRVSLANVEGLKNVLRYHGEPANICQHVNQTGAVMNTGASFIVDPCRGEMHVLQGFPCQEKYQTFRLDSPSL